MKLFEQLAKTVANNTKIVFGLIGDGNLFMVDSFQKHGGKYVGTYHEANAVMAAFGSARSTGEIGFATVTHGPGLTNTVTALLEAQKSHTPLVLLAGRTPRNRVYHPQSIDQRKLIEGINIRYIEATTVDDAVDVTVKAFDLARSESGPVVVAVPVELMWEESNRQHQARRVLEPPMPDMNQLETALGIIASARRPILIAGGGARHATLELKRLADVLGAALATTWQAKDAFVDEEENIGIFGTLSSPLALETIALSDCFVFFGAGLNPNTTDAGRLVSGRPVVHVDVDSHQHGKYISVTAPVVGDASSTAREMRERLSSVDHQPTSFSQRVVERKGLWAPRRVRVEDAPQGTVNLAATLRYLNEQLPHERRVVMDVGNFEIHAMLEFQAPSGQSWIAAGNGFEAIGHGLGTAIGVASSQPEQLTVLIVGDGGLMLSGISELRRAVELNLALVCIVCNNKSYAAEHYQFVERNMDPEISYLEVPDFALLAKSVGATGLTVRSRLDLENVVVAVRENIGPVLIDVHCAPDEDFGIAF